MQNPGARQGKLVTVRKEITECQKCYIGRINSYMSVILQFFLN